MQDSKTVQKEKEQLAKSESKDKTKENQEHSQDNCCGGCGGS